MSKFATVFALVVALMNTPTCATTPAHAFFNDGAWGPYTGTIYLLGAEESRRRNEKEQKQKKDSAGDFRTGGSLECDQSLIDRQEQNDRNDREGLIVFLIVLGWLVASVVTVRLSRQKNSPKN